MIHSTEHALRDFLEEPQTPPVIATRGRRRKLPAVIPPEHHHYMEGTQTQPGAPPRVYLSDGAIVSGEAL